MCGRYVSYQAISDIQLEFELDAVSSSAQSLRPSWNVAPTTDVAIVLERLAEAPETASPAQFSRELHLARWGLLPPWAKSETSGPLLINARIETVAEKKSFSASLAKRRCIIPADGYFEWKKDGASKQPFYIHSEKPLAFAGLYSWWKATPDTWLLTTTIITRQAIGGLAAIHERTPAIVEPDEYGAWLDPDLVDPEEALAILERPNRPLIAQPVGSSVGNIRNNSPENIIPIS